MSHLFEDREAAADAIALMDALVEAGYLRRPTGKPPADWVDEWEFPPAFFEDDENLVVTRCLLLDRKFIEEAGFEPLVRWAEELLTSRGSPIAEFEERSEQLGWVHTVELNGHVADFGRLGGGEPSRDRTLRRCHLSVPTWPDNVGAAMIPTATLIGVDLLNRVLGPQPDDAQWHIIEIGGEADILIFGPGDDLPLWKRVGDVVDSRAIPAVLADADQGDQNA